MKTPKTLDPPSVIVGLRCLRCEKTTHIVAGSVQAVQGRPSLLDVRMSLPDGWARMEMSRTITDNYDLLYPELTFDGDEPDDMVEQTHTGGCADFFLCPKCLRNATEAKT